MIAFALCAGALALLALYFYCTRTFNYWQRRGIKHDQPVLFFGTNTKCYLLQQSITQAGVDTYWKYPGEKVVGFFRSTRPELVLRDPALVKRVLLTDFSYFHARGLNPHKQAVEPLLRNLFFADGDLWRLLRQRMTGAFTSGKLRAMFPLVVERAERLQARTLLAAAAGRAVDARDLMARYTTDFIGAVGFGLDGDALSDEDSAFRRLGFTIFDIKFKDAVKAVFKEIFPNLLKHVKYLSRAEPQMRELVADILKRRHHKPSGRNDFIDLMLECQQKGRMEGESLEKFKQDGTPEHVTMELSDELIVAQVFVFFAAGFETSSSATSFTLHQLAYHPEAQAKVQAEVDQVLARHGGRLSYDAVKEMKYLECAFKEGMRMFPSLGFLLRECVRPYTFPELGVSIDEGVGVLIPLQALHNDPLYFDEPHEFRPERFLVDEVGARAKYAYLPFGEGPCACIGARLGTMQSLAGLAALLARFSVAPGPTTLRHPIVEPKSDVVQSIKGGLPLMFLKRNTSTS